MLRIIIMTFSLIAVVAVNVAANIVPFNGSTTGEISNRLPILFTPASYVFLIWPVIYLLLAAWLIRFWIHREDWNNHLKNRKSGLIHTGFFIQHRLDFTLALRIFHLDSRCHGGTSCNTYRFLFYVSQK